MKEIFVHLLLFTIIISSNNFSQSENGWSKPIPISVVGERSFYPAMAVGKEGKIFVVWENHNQSDNEDKAQIYLAEYDGSNWLEPEVLTDKGNMNWTPDIAVDTSGNPHIVWGEWLSSEIYYKYYDGQKWSESKNVSEDSGESYYPRIAIDLHNKVHVVWHDNTRGGDPSVYYRYNDDSQWSEKFIVSDTLEYSIFPRIAIDSKDNIHITWFSREPPDDNRDVFYRKLNGNNWSKIDRLTDDTLYSIYPVIVLTKTDLPIIIWRQDLDYLAHPYVAKIYWSTNNGSTWSQPEAMEKLSQADRPSVGIDKYENIHATWQLSTWVGVTIYDSIMYSYFNGSVWSTPINITGSTCNKNSTSPVIKTDINGNLHVIWLSFGDEWPYAPVVYYTHHGSIVGIQENQFPKIPTNLSILQNYPNPFNSNTIIKYSIPNASFVTITVFDALGRKIKMLVNSEQKSGFHSISFDGSDISTGCYFYQLRANGNIITKKMLLIR
ncbi:MAG: T9SS type A sorting domain-containing protein [Ignavibacteriaceae bacterium]